jgi:hypothetical protein
MPKPIRLLLLCGVMSVGLLSQRPLFAQACQDEEAMVVDYKKTITGLVATVQKESLADFERLYHRKSCLVKLTLCGSVLDGLVVCLEKAPQDPTATKEQKQAYTAKHESYSKLKEKVAQYRDSLKATEVGKEAKALIEKFDLAN